VIPQEYKHQSQQQLSGLVSSRGPVSRIRIQGRTGAIYYLNQRPRNGFVLPQALSVRAAFDGKGDRYH
jgi:hypothetical protein